MDDRQRHAGETCLEAASVLAFGHSHLGAFEKGLVLLDHETGSPLRATVVSLWGRFETFYTVENGELVYNPDLLAEICQNIETARPVCLLAFLLGSEHFSLSYQATERVFDISMPDSASPPPHSDAELIPYGILYDMAHSTLRPYLGLMRRLIELTGLPIFYILPPPPVDSLEFRIDKLPPDLKQMTDRYYMPVTELAAKSWKLHATVTQDICREFGVTVVSPPEAALDTKGMLLEQHAEDCVHGNAEYGRLLVEKLAALLGARAPVGEHDAAPV